MKTIQWYPGHMAKAMREIKESLSLSDAVVFVLDARAPASSYNRKLTELVGERPVLFLLNKADLAGEEAKVMTARIRAAGKQAVLLNATDRAEARKLQLAMQTVAAEKIARLKEKGSGRPVRFLVAGVPNTGKSTVINLLNGSRRAQVGDKAGVTRRPQWVRCGEFELLDNPGTMPPSFSDQRAARRLAFLGCINDDILEFDEIALALLEELSVLMPGALDARYGIGGGTPSEMLVRIAQRRGFVLRGGEIDFERAERALVDDFRKGKLGAVCLDGESDLIAADLI